MNCAAPFIGPRSPDSPQLDLYGKLAENYEKISKHPEIVPKLLEAPLEISAVH